jgi:hypothetical protein
MCEELEKRKKELERQANVSLIEAESLNLGIEEKKEFKIKDIQAYQRIRVRFNRLKKETGREYLTNLNGNKVVVTRKI